jgi:hypothetical protein
MVQGIQCRVWGLGFRLLNLGLISILGFSVGVQGSGFLSVWGIGFGFGG